MATEQTDILFPEQLDIILPILDGWTPIDERDLNVYTDVIRQIEEVLGAGPTGVVIATGIGPSSANANVAERIGRFLDPDGSMHDIAFASGTIPIGWFSEDNSLGAFIRFGKRLSNTTIGGSGYMVLLTFQSSGSEDVSGVKKWKEDAPGSWWITRRFLDGVYIKGRDLGGNKIDKSNQGSVNYAILVFGYESFSTGQT